MGASLVNYALATSLETWKSSATDASMLCQQTVTKIYFKSTNARLFRTAIRVQVLLCGNMQMLPIFNELAWLSQVGILDGVKKKNSRRLLNYNKGEASNFLL